MSNVLIHSNIKLSVGMLVSNHKQYIRNCMESLKPLLDAVPSELVVLDTKGADSDGSIDIVREYTDHIYPYQWCNDFSDARNTCLSHTKGEWFLYLDDDEWFDNVQEFIDFFQNGDCEKYNSGRYYIHNYDSEGHVTVSIAGRMIRRRENTCFEGKIHEGFNEIHLPCKQFSCFTHHYGYAFLTLEDAKKHQERNISILKEELQSKGYHPSLCAQFVQETLYLEETKDQAYTFAKEALSHFSASQWSNTCVQWILVSTVRYFCLKGDYSGAKKELQLLEQNYFLSELARLALMGLMANLANEAGDTAAVLHYVNQYLELYRWQASHPEEVILQTQLDFPFFFQKDYYHRMLYLGANASRILQANPKLTLLKPVFSMLELMEHATNDLPSIIRKGDFALLDEYLQTLQETAISVGNRLEEIMGEGLSVIPLLEQFCEHLWECHNAKTPADAEAFADVLMDSVPNIKASFLSDTDYPVN